MSPTHVQRLRTAGLFALFGFAVISLVVGADWLDRPITYLGGLPVGTLLFWAGLIAGARLAMAVPEPPAIVHFTSLGATSLALLWLPISLALSPNVELDFPDGTAGDVWTVVTVVTTLVVLGSLVLAVGWWALRRSRATGSETKREP